MRHRTKQKRSLGIRDLDQLADHRLIVLLAALVEAQARPRSMRHQLHYTRRLRKWYSVPLLTRAAAIQRHSLRNSLTIREEVQQCGEEEKWKY
jgi:hypothetical protein